MSNWPKVLVNSARATSGRRPTVVAPAFAAKNFRHLAGTKAKARWNATTADAPTEPTATHGAAAAKWDPRRVGYYRSRFQEETACLSRG